MLWGHRAYSNTSALHLRYFRRSDALRARRSRVRITRPGPRPLARQEVDRAPGDADDVSRPGLDKWRCLCLLGS